MHDFYIKSQGGTNSPNSFPYNQGAAFKINVNNTLIACNKKSIRLT